MPQIPNTKVYNKAYDSFFIFDTFFDANQKGHMLKVFQREQIIRMKQDETGKFYVKGVSKQNKPLVIYFSMS